VDGVERVMVLGILAVIVAILSFAWSATEEGVTPAGVDGSPSSGVIPLSSNTSTNGAVVIEPPKLLEQISDPESVGDEQARIRKELLKRPGSGDPSGTERRRPTSRRSSSNPQQVNALTKDRSRLQGSGVQGTGMQPKTAVIDPRFLPPGVDPAKLSRDSSEVTGVLPSTEVPNQPIAASGEESEKGSDEPRETRFYTVQPGDTLWTIASREVKSGDTKRMVALIQELNPGLEASTMAIGRTIKLPSATLQSLVKNKTPTERVETSGGRIYQVQEGDTLGGIAETELGSGKLWKDIYQLNKDIITDPARIRPGMRLVLPTLVDGQVQDLGQGPGQDQEP